MLTSQTIPAWVVATLMVFNGLLWLVANHKLTKDETNFFGWVYMFWGFMFLIFFEFLNPGVELRGFISRSLMIIISISQAIPQLMSIIRKLRKCQQHQRL